MLGTGRGHSLGVRPVSPRPTCSGDESPPAKTRENQGKRRHPGEPRSGALGGQRPPAHPPKHRPSLSPHGGPLRIPAVLEADERHMRPRRGNAGEMPGIAGIAAPGPPRVPQPSPLCPPPPHQQDQFTRTSSPVRCHTPAPCSHQLCWHRRDGPQGAMPHGPRVSRQHRGVRHVPSIHPAQGVTDLSQNSPRGLARLAWWQLCPQGHPSAPRDTIPVPLRGQTGTGRRGSQIPATAFPWGHLSVTRGVCQHCPMAAALGTGMSQQAEPPGQLGGAGTAVGAQGGFAFLQNGERHNLR